MTAIDPLASFRLDGRVAVVTGASSGLGERFARVLVAAGARVVVTARRKDRLDVLVAALGSGPDGKPNALGVAVDLTSPGAPADLVASAVSTFGRVDILVNNAGVSRVINPADYEVDEFRREIEIDLVAPFELARQCARWWLANQHPGAVINIGSILGLVAGGRLRVPGYGAAKGGLHQLTRELASAWARRGIRVNAIAPAWFETEMTDEAMFGNESGRRYVETGTPMGRGGREHELDGALIYLASDASSYVTGQVLAVDGGWTAI